MTTQKHPLIDIIAAQGKIRDELTNNKKKITTI